MVGGGGSIINVGLWEQVARSIFGITGANPIPRLNDHVLPVAVLQSDRPEWSYNGGEVKWSTTRRVLAVAAQQAFMIIRNPPTSGSLSIVEACWGNGLNPATEAYVVGMARDTLVSGVGSVASVRTRDSRFAPDAGPAGFQAATELRHGTAAAPGISDVDLIDVPANTPTELGIILHPGFSVSLRAITANVALNFTFIGYEKPLHKGKRA